jgi:hypothetical protein
LTSDNFVFNKRFCKFSEITKCNSSQEKDLKKEEDKFG